MNLRNGNYYRRIADRLLDSPQQEDLEDARLAIFNLLDERTRLAARIVRLSPPPKAGKGDSPKPPRRWALFRKRS
jgi:hypothetical protein